MSHGENKMKGVFHEAELKPNIEVLERFAEVFCQITSLKKTHLHFASRTSWGSFVRYLKWLLTKKYVEYVSYGNEEKYQLTQNGRVFFNTVLKLKEQIRSSKSILL